MLKSRAWINKQFLIAARCCRVKTIIIGLPYQRVRVLRPWCDKPPPFSPLYLSLSLPPVLFLPLFPSECPPATETSGFGSVLEEGSPSKLSRRAQHNEERYFVKRRRRYGVNDRMDEWTNGWTNGDGQTDGWMDGQTPRKDSADIYTNKKKIRDAVRKLGVTNVTEWVSGPLRPLRALHLGSFAARACSLALFLSRFLRLKRNKCVFTLNMKDF